MLRSIRLMMSILDAWHTEMELESSRVSAAAATVILRHRTLCQRQRDTDATLGAAQYIP